jgi:hypothetical protein
MKSILSSFTVAIALLGAAGCTANVSNPKVDQGGQNNSTTECTMNCGTTETSCAAKCSDNTCKAGCTSAQMDCVTQCSSGDGG